MVPRTEETPSPYTYTPYINATRPILTYGAETWAATESKLQKLHIFERKILRKIYGPDKDQENWRIRTN
jgi:hypothetical protein